MPITSSAKKALRSSHRKRVYNVVRKDAMKGAIKEIRKLALAGKKAEAVALLPKAYAVIDKAAKGKTIKKGNADRKKARITAVVNKIK